MLGFCSLLKRVCTHAYSEKIMKGMSTEMASKIKLKNRKIQTIEEVFALFVISRTADGVSETTLKTYHNHFHTISLYLDVQQPLTDLTKSDLEGILLKPFLWRGLTLKVCRRIFDSGRRSWQS